LRGRLRPLALLTILRVLELKIGFRDELVDFNYEPKRLIHF